MKNSPENQTSRRPHAGIRTPTRKEKIVEYSQQVDDARADGSAKDIAPPLTEEELSKRSGLPYQDKNGRENGSVLHVVNGTLYIASEGDDDGDSLVWQDVGPVYQH